MTCNRLLPALALGLGLTWLVTGVLSARAAVRPATGSTLYVSQDCARIPNCYSTVQKAISVARDDDTILVAQGTYSETVIITKSVSLEGGWNDDFTMWDRNTYVSTIDAQRSGPAVRVAGTASPTIEGFTITGGDATHYSGLGGGIRISDTGRVSIRYNVITNNVGCAAHTCKGQGGGIGAISATVRIIDNAIVSNVADTSEVGGGAGGGVFFHAPISATLVGNQILSNTATFTGTGRGGGVCVDGVANLRDNLLRGNIAGLSGDGSGGGLYAMGLLTLEHNSIVENDARSGGGLYLGWDDDSQLVRHNLIARNRATGVGRMNDGGGGITSEGDLAEIRANHIVSNSASHFGGGVLLVGGSQFVVRDNTLSENVAEFGGGAFFFSASGSLSRNWITGNQAVARGGGIYLYAGSAPGVDSNRILSNTVALGEGGGICIRNNHVPVTLTNQIIAHNSAIGVGSGLLVSLATEVAFINNTIVDNASLDGAEGIAVLEHSQITATNNILVGHKVAVTVSVGSTASLAYNGFWDNAINVSGLPSGTNSTSLVLEPEFVNRAAADYHLESESQLIGAGDTSVNVPYDFEGDPRSPIQGIDIGADEFSYHIYLPEMLRN